MKQIILVFLFLIALASSSRAENVSYLNFLKDSLNKYPGDISLWSDIRLESRLRNLLGTKYSDFVENMGVNTPLKEFSGIVWTSGNKPHDGGVNAALFLADTNKDVLEVYLLKDKRLTHYGESSISAVLSGEADLVLKNFRESDAKDSR